NQFLASALLREATLASADVGRRIVTLGWTTSWHHVDLHINARLANPGEAMQTVKVYLLKGHSEDQLPSRPPVKGTTHTNRILSPKKSYPSEVHRTRHWFKVGFRTITGQCVRWAGRPSRAADRGMGLRSAGPRLHSF